MGRRPVGVTVLIADDAEVARNLYKRVLVRAGYQVLLTLDGLETVEVALRERPSIVLMDVAMPGIDGLEAMRRIKSAIPSMPVVIASARAMSSDKESYYIAGADEVLSKPFRLAELLATVARFTA